MRDKPFFGLPGKLHILACVVALPFCVGIATSLCACIGYVWKTGDIRLLAMAREIFLWSEPGCPACPGDQNSVWNVLIGFPLGILLTYGFNCATLAPLRRAFPEMKESPGDPRRDGE